MTIFHQQTWTKQQNEGKKSKTDFFLKSWKTIWLTENRMDPENHQTGPKRMKQKLGLARAQLAGCTYFNVNKWTHRENKI